MTLTPVTLEKYLRFDDYGMSADPKDPGQEDIAFLVYVARLIPRTPLDIANVDPGILASYCLAAHQTASQIHSEATLWWRLKDIAAQSALATAIVDAGAPATNAEKRAKSNPTYVRAAEIAAKGEAYVRFLDNMKTNFETGHYWAKGQETSANKEKTMSGYDPHKIQTGGVKQQAGQVEEAGKGNTPLGEFDF